MYTLGSGRILIKSIIIVCLLNLMAWLAVLTAQTRFVSLILMTLCCQLILPQNAETTDNLSEWQFVDNVKESVADTRVKRSLLQISGMRKVFTGIRAIRQLLKGTKPIISPREGRSDYIKQGDYGTAVGDFFALRPTDIQDIKHADAMGQVVGKRGTVGNLLITVEHRSQTDTAVTEIIKGAGTEKQRTVKQILYVESRKIFNQVDE